MVQALIKGLIGIAVAVLCIYLVLWFLAAMGIVLPTMVVKVFMVIVVLVVILFLYQILIAPGMKWWSGQ